MFTSVKCMLQSHSKSESGRNRGHCNCLQGNVERCQEYMQSNPTRPGGEDGHSGDDQDFPEG